MKYYLLSFCFLITSLYSEDYTVELRHVAVSVPIEIVKMEGLWLSPDRLGKNKKLMSNSEFQKVLSGLLSHQKVYKLYDTKVKSVSGKTYVSKSVEEYLFPESYKTINENTNTANLTVNIYDSDGKILIEKAKNHLASSLKAEFIKGKATGIQAIFGETSDIGEIIESTPLIDPDRNTVSVDFKPQLTALMGWREYDKEHGIKMPVIRSLTQETRFALKKGNTFLTAVLYDQSIPDSLSQLTASESKEEQVILLFTSVENENKVAQKKVKEPLHVLYTEIKVEVPETVAAKLQYEDEKFLKDESFKFLLKEIQTKKASSILSINSGITINGYTGVTRNVIEAYFPESVIGHDIKNKNVLIPQLVDTKDVGSVLEFTPQIGPDNKTVEMELKAQLVKLTGWTQKEICNGMPLLKSDSIDTRVTTSNGKVLVLNSGRKQSGFHMQKENKVILNLFFVELK